MKPSRILLSAFAASGSVQAIPQTAATQNAFTFTLPLSPGSTGQTSALTVNLNGITKGNFSDIVNNIGSSSTAVTTALENQMPDFIKAIQTTTQDCDLQCCELACAVLFWIPFAWAICIAGCEGSHSDS